MKIKFATLADCANQTADHKLNIMGTFGRVNWTGPETVVPVMYLVLLLDLEPSDFGMEQQYRIAFTNPLGNDVVPPLEATGTVPPAPADGGITTSQIASFFGTSFPDPGTYTFRLYVNDVEVFAMPLPVIDVRNER